MGRMTAVQHQYRTLPRGWFITAAALASWALFAGIWIGMSQLFQFVLAAF